VIVRNVQAQNILVQADGVTIEDSHVVGFGSGNSGITILANNSTVQRCDISGVERGVWVEGNGSLVQDNYIHDLVANPGNTDPHFDGVQIPSSSNVIIRHNNLDLRATDSSPITMKDATNIIIDDNRLNGGTYTIYFEGNTTGAQVT